MRAWKLLMAMVQETFSYSGKYANKERYNISFAWCFKLKQWFSSGSGAVIRACADAVEGPKFEPVALFPLLDQKVRPCGSCEVSGKKFEDCGITLACASVKTEIFLQKQNWLHGIPSKKQLDNTQELRFVPRKFF